MGAWTGQRMKKEPAIRMANITAAVMAIRRRSLRKYGIRSSGMAAFCGGRDRPGAGRRRAGGG